jgi:methylthioribose-1-phosphate isomerase
MLSSDAVPILRGNREVSFCEELFLSTTNPKRAMASVLSTWQRVEATRGAPLIDVASAYGVALAMRTDTSNAALDWAYDTLIATRLTAIKLKLALKMMRKALCPQPPSAHTAVACAPAKSPSTTSKSTGASVSTVLS